MDRVLHRCGGVYEFRLVEQGDSWREPLRVVFSSSGRVLRTCVKTWIIDPVIASILETKLRVPQRLFLITGAPHEKREATRRSSHDRFTRSNQSLAGRRATDASSPSEQCGKGIAPFYERLLMGALFRCDHSWRRYSPSTRRDGSSLRH
jgi:hypothetical protein